MKRFNWINEELGELMDATIRENIYEQVDAFIDIIYFSLGGLVELGVPPADIFKAVQDANMSKLHDGKPKYREDGKVIKPDGWQPPEPKIKEIIDELIQTKERKDNCEHLNIESTHPYGWKACRDCRKLM
jgi:predicted HAD superfamily Cof-like phosphohydrolase